jgi:hypothetical protein
MAEFVKPDGTVIRGGQPILPEPEEIGLIGYIDQFDITMDTAVMERYITIRLRVNEVNVARAGGLVPHIQTGGKVQIRAVR